MRFVRQRSSWIGDLGFLGLVVVAGLLLVACGGSPPRIVVEPASQNLGEVPQELLELTYIVRNEGGSPLRIERVSTSCGCTNVKSNFPELADAIACERLSQVENGRLCTACPLCYAHFKETADGVEVLELSEALTHNLEMENVS